MSSFLLINELQQRLNDELQDWYLEHPIGNNIQRAKPNIIIGRYHQKLARCRLTQRHNNVATAMFHLF